MPYKFFLKSSLLLFVFTLSWSLFSFAQADKNQPSVTSVTKKKSIKNPSVLSAQVNLDLRHLNYTSTSLADESSVQQMQLGLNLKRQGTFFTNTDLVVGTLSTPNSFYFTLPESYMGWGDKFSSLTIGKKIENLSFADSFFNFGLIQPYATQDHIEYVRGGLVSMGAHHFENGLGFNLAFNPLFVPNQGPAVKVDDGKIITSSRWASQPPAAFKFGDENRDIIYAIRDFKITDIIANTGYYANIYFGDSPERPTFSMTYGNKPVNELALSRDTYSDIATFKGNVILNPIVLNHEFYAADVNLDTSHFKTTFSFFGDHPSNKIAPDLETIQTLSPLSIYSVYLGLDMLETIGKKIEVYAAAAVISGGDIKDLNSAGQEGSFNFATSRTLYKKPIKVGFKGEIYYIYNQPIEADLNLTYDQELKGSLLSTNFKYKATKNINLRLGADLIGVENELVDQRQSNFLDQNKANDRFTAGVGYVF